MRPGARNSLVIRYCHASPILPSLIRGIESQTFQLPSYIFFKCHVPSLRNIHQFDILILISANSDKMHRLIEYVVANSTACNHNKKQSKRTEKNFGFYRNMIRLHRFLTWMELHFYLFHKFTPTVSHVCGSSFFNHHWYLTTFCLFKTKMRIVNVIWGLKLF